MLQTILNVRFFRFFLAGGFMTLLASLCFYWLAEFLAGGFIYYLCCGVIYFSITVFNYYVQKKWVFVQYGRIASFLLATIFLSCVFLVLQYIFINLITGDLNGLSSVVCYWCSSLVLLPISYFINKKVFSCD